MEKTLCDVESSSSAEGAFVRMEEFVCAEDFSLFHSNPWILPSKLWIFIWFWICIALCISATTIKVIILFILFIYQKSVHWVFMFVRRGRRVLGCHHWTQMKKSKYLDRMETRSGHALFFFVEKRREIDYAVYDLLWKTSACCRNKQQISLKHTNFKVSSEVKSVDLPVLAWKHL